MARLWQRDLDEPHPPAEVGGGTRLTSPFGLDRAGWRAVLSGVSRRIKRDRVSVTAGSLAYHFFLALFPAVIAALGVLTLADIGSGTLHTITHGIEKSMPSGSAGVFKGAVQAATRRSSGATTAVVVGVAIALWSVSSAMAVLQQALDIAYEVPTDRTYLSRRIRAVPLMVTTALLGGVAALLVVFGQPVGSTIRGVVPVGGAAFTVPWTALRWIVAFAAVSLLFFAYYTFAPKRPNPGWAWVSPGALVAAAIFLLASLGFSLYVSSFGSYGKTYGSFAGVAILIFWLYLTAMAVLAGGELNAELEHVAASGVAPSLAASEAGEGPAVSNEELEPPDRLFGT